MPHRHHPANIVRLLALLAIVMAPLAAFAQARSTASRAAGIDIFAAATELDDDFYGRDHKLGGTVGIDYTQFRYIPRFHALFTPSLEMRVTFGPGTPIAEHTLQGGAKLAVNYHRFHPYGDLLLGGGTILFNPGVELEHGFLYSSDSSFVWVYGGGTTIDILPRWALIADYEHQSWNLGFTPPVQFHPQSVSIGVVYHLRLKAFR